MRDFLKSKISVISNLRFRSPTRNEAITLTATWFLTNLPRAQGWEIGTGAAATIGVGGFCGACICCLWCWSSFLEHANQNQNPVRREGQQNQQPLLQNETVININPNPTNLN